VGNLQFADVVLLEGPAIQFADLALTGTGSGGSIQFADVLLTGTAVSAGQLDTSGDTLDAGQILTLTASGGTAPYTWAVLSMTNSVPAPTPTVSGDTVTATIQAPPTLDGSKMVVGMTPTGGAQIQVTITVLPSTRVLNVAGVATPIFAEVLV
jgi:hypothetical protein